ncbi:MAG: hypothetical protein CMM83_05670 [Rhodospirillales bacterium]|nr:hypothetical protein [Rhodospirillales bacterium]
MMRKVEGVLQHYELTYFVEKNKSVKERSLKTSIIKNRDVSKCFVDFKVYYSLSLFVKPIPMSFKIKGSTSVWIKF